MFGSASGFGAAKSPSLLGGGGGSSDAAGEMLFGFATAGSDVAKNPCPCCTLTFKQRCIGFLSCFGVGMLISFVSTTKLWTGDIQGFATLYSIGNVVALISTGFLVGASRLRATRTSPCLRCAARRARARAAR